LDEGPFILDEGRRRHGRRTSRHGRDQVRWMFVEA
jgi:hypothetical protein